MGADRRLKNLKLAAVLQHRLNKDSINSLCKTKLCLGCVQNCLIGWSFANLSAITATTTLNRACGSEILVVVHSVVKASSHAVTCHDNIIPIEIILMAWDGCRDTEPRADVRVSVIVMVIVVASKIILHRLAAIDQEVVPM